MYKLCTLCSKLYRVVVNFISWNVGIGSIDDLVEKRRDRKWWFIWVASLFLIFSLLFSRYFLISRKTKISFKPGPTLKVLMIHDYYLLYLWFDGKWIAKLIYDVSVLELRWNNCMCENYTPLRGFPLLEWTRCFLWCSLEQNANWS